jgi:hypothetical protein
MSAALDVRVAAELMQQSSESSDGENYIYTIYLKYTQAMNRCRSKW